MRLDPVRAWNWQRRLMCAVAVVAVIVAVVATKNSPWPQIVYAVGWALLFASLVRLVAWVLLNVVRETLANTLDCINVPQLDADCDEPSWQSRIVGEPPIPKLRVRHELVEISVANRPTSKTLPEMVPTSM